MPATPVQLVAGTLHITNAVGQRSTCTFSTYDTTGATHYAQGQPILLYDVQGNLAYAGFVASSKEVPTAQGNTLEYAITGMDNHYLADKRRVVASYTGQACGTIAANIIDTILVNEGVAGTHRQAVLVAKPTSFYKLADAAPGTSPADSSGNSHTATKHGTITFGQASLLADGSGDTSALFDGSTGYLSVPTTGLATGAQPLSQLAVVQIAAHPASAAVIACQGTWGVSGQCCYLSIDTSGRPVFTLTGKVSVTGTALALNTPHFLQGTYDGAFLRLYVDGVLAGTSVNVTAALTASAATIGASTAATPGNFFGGILAYVAFAPNAIAFWQAMQLKETGSNQCIQAGATPGAFTSNYGTAADCFDALAQYTNYYWQIDQYRVLWFAARGAQLAPISITVNVTVRTTTSATRSNPQYRNQQYVLGATTTTASQTETRQGDGKATAFTFSYPLAGPPSALTLNGVGQSVGVKGVDSGKQWYYAIGDPILAQDSSGTKLVATDTLSMTYKGTFPVVTLSGDPAQQAINQATEGNTTSGIVEDVYEDTSLTSSADAFLVGAGKLQAYSTAGLQYVFTTSASGLQAGQVVSVTDPLHGISNQQMFIQQIDISDQGPIGNEVGAQLWYTATCLIGPSNMTWVQYFAALSKSAAAPTNNTINVGSSATLIVAQTYNGTWPTWTGTLTASVFACPICGPSTLCGPSTIVC